MRLTQEEARRHILGKQGLAKTRFPNPPDAFRAVLAVQTQYPASVAPALAARASGVSAKWLEAALGKHRTVLKGWNLRFTLHASLAEDHMLMQRAFEAGHIRSYANWMARHGVPADDLERLKDEIWKALGERPMGRRELHEIVPFFKGRFMVGWGLDVMGLAVEGKVVLSKQGAANTEFARLEVWSPNLKPCPLTEQEARAEIARRYFAGYGPATIADFLYWTGQAAVRGREILASIRDELTKVEIEGKSGMHYMLGEPAPAVSLPVRFLPKFDPLMMGYRDKSLFLPERLRSQVFRKAGQVEAVVLAEGQVRGAWRSTRKGSRLEFNIEPFGKMKAAWRGGIQREASSVAKALGFTGEARIVEAT